MQNSSADHQNGWAGFRCEVLWHSPFHLKTCCLASQFLFKRFQFGAWSGSFRAPLPNLSRPGRLLPERMEGMFSLVIKSLCHGTETNPSVLLFRFSSLGRLGCEQGFIVYVHPRGGSKSVFLNTSADQIKLELWVSYS